MVLIRHHVALELVEGGNLRAWHQTDFRAKGSQTQTQNHMLNEKVSGLGFRV